MSASAAQIRSFSSDTSGSESASPVPSFTLLPSPQTSAPASATPVASETPTALTIPTPSNLGVVPHQLYYVTDREPSNNPPPFGNQPSEECIDLFECIEHYGSIEPRENATTPAASFQELTSEIDLYFLAHPELPRELVIYIHGCCSDFTTATSDARIIGSVMTHLPVILYSFPARPSSVLLMRSDYTSDETESAWSTVHLAYLLDSLLTSFPAQPVQLDIMAHSLGNRVLLPALQQFAGEHSDLVGNARRINTILFMAPDVDQATFVESTAVLQSLANSIDVYRSAIDVVVKTSQVIHEHPRLGLTNPGFDGRDRLYALDASTFVCGPSPELLSGHFYWKASTIVEKDISLALQGVTPDQQDRAAALHRVGLYAWKFAPPRGMRDSCIHV